MAETRKNTRGEIALGIGIFVVVVAFSLWVAWMQVDCNNRCRPGAGYLYTWQCFCLEKPI